MPQVPDLVPDVAPTTGGPAGPSPNVPADAFGGAVGHALQGLGSTIEQGSDRIWARAMDMQNLNNETEAKTADADYMMQAGMLHANYSALEGEQAKAAFPKYMQDLQDARTAVRGKLSNPMAQKMFDASSLSVMGRTIFNGAGHAAQQTKVAASNASQARVDQMSDGIGNNPTDELTAQRYTRGIAAETRSQGAMHGWSPEQTEETVKQNVSTALAKRIVGLSRTDAIGAQAMFDRATKSGDLLPVMADRVQGSVQTQFRQQGSRVISDKVLADRRAGEDDPKTENDYISEGLAQADAIAKKTGIKDPLFQDFVRERIMSDYRRQKTVERDDGQVAEQTVASAMLSGNKEGVLPKSVDELRLVSPEVSVAWDRMQPTQQKKYMHEMAMNQLGNRVTWNNENLATYQQMKGQAHDNPVDFLARDVISENIPATAKRELINLQQRMRGQSESDPRVARAVSLLTPDLRAAGISRDADKEGYYQFVGGLQDALDQFQSDKKKVPSAEEVRTIGARLMQQQAGTGWFGSNVSATPLYQVPVPDKDMDRIRQLPIWRDRDIRNPTDAMIQRYYHAEQYKKLYGGSAKPAGSLGNPPAPVSQ